MRNSGTGALTEHWDGSAWTVVLGPDARFYNAVQNKDVQVFWHELAFFCGLAVLFIVAAVYQLYLQQWLRIRWRTWLTDKYLARWLREGTHYRMRSVGDPADNPDQRIAEDLELFTVRTIELSIGLLNAVVTIASPATTRSLVTRVPMLKPVWPVRGTVTPLRAELLRM